MRLIFLVTTPANERKEMLTKANRTLVQQFIATVLVAGCVSAYASDEPAQCQELRSKYDLVWADEFDGPTISTANWNLEVRGDGCGNNEWQYYTDRTTGSNANAFIENGKLVIAARYENYGGKMFTSARLNTKLKVTPTYGMIEARIKAPSNALGVWDQGSWPAFWMMGSRSDAWPYCGEIDIFEMTGRYPRNLVGSVFWSDYISDYSVPKNKVPGYPGIYTLPNSASEEYHTYAIVWDDTMIYWYLDGVQRVSYMKVINKTEAQQFDHKGLNAHSIPPACQQTFMNPFYMILNIAVGGDWDQVGTPNPANYPQFMYMDWVRVWKPARWSIVNSSASKALWMSNEGRFSLWSVDAQCNALTSKHYGPFPGWKPVNCSDNKVLWVSNEGKISLWSVDAQCNAPTYKEYGPFPGWKPVNCSDNKALWVSNEGKISLWSVDAQCNVPTYKEYGPFPGWQPVNCSDNKMLWVSNEGKISLWSVDAQCNAPTYKEYGPFPGWKPVNCSDNKVLWVSNEGKISLWSVDAQCNALMSKEYGPFPGWQPVNCSDNKVLWVSNEGKISLWSVDAQCNALTSKEYGP
jgi:beta-glucanase (GH16 family)